jgi:hypothetical protein
MTCEKPDALPGGRLHRTALWRKLSPPGLGGN